MKTRSRSFKALLITLLAFILFGCTDNGYINIEKSDLRLVEREFEDIEGMDPAAISLNRVDASGLAIIETLEFEHGIIEVDLLGENNPGKSFIGIAFNIQNDSTYEAVYFRPFNFFSKEQIRRNHGMEYIFHPEYPWYRLRKEHDGEFEAEFLDPPNPDDWFRVRIIVKEDQVMVEDPRTGEQLMQCRRLTSTVSDKIGFWTGFGSNGSFRNLQLQLE